MFPKSPLAITGRDYTRRYKVITDNCLTTGVIAISPKKKKNKLGKRIEVSQGWDIFNLIFFNENLDINFKLLILKILTVDE